MSPELDTATMTVAATLEAAMPSLNVYCTVNVTYTICCKCGVVSADDRKSSPRLNDDKENNARYDIKPECLDCCDYHLSLEQLSLLVSAMFCISEPQRVTVSSNVI